MDALFACVHFTASVVTNLHRQGAAAVTAKLQIKGLDCCASSRAATPLHASTSEVR